MQLPSCCAAVLLILAALTPRAAAGAPHSMTLVWTATGDDADQGRAYRYELRYSTGSVGNLGSWWSGATSATNLPAPSASGVLDSTVVTGLTAETTYHFVLRVYDEAGNASGFSNVVTATTDSEIPPPPTGCDPPAAAPAQFAARADSGDVLLSWAPTLDPLAEALIIWRALGSAGLSVLATVSDPARTEYRDTTARAGNTYRYRAAWSNSCGNGPPTASSSVSVPAESAPPAPGVNTGAVHAYPNPSRDAVQFVIHVEGDLDQIVHLRLFDLSGRVIADIANGSFPSGDTVVSWPRVTSNGDRVAPGYYESIGTIGSFPVRERLVLLP